MLRAVTAVHRGRRLAETLMVDSCTITGPSTRTGPVDPETGLRELVPGPQRYAGKCKVQTYEAHESTPQSGEHYYTVQRYYVHVPVGAGPVFVNDEVSVDSLVLDPSTAVRKFRVAGLLHKSHATAQRLLVDEITA